MNLINASCCCATTGRCCILDTTNPNLDCQDSCVDNKTPAQCTALGGVWEAGLCSDIDPDACIGVCCATTTAGYFVACQENVTQCECLSDNLALNVNTTWHSGSNLTCADIACPCQCAELCPCDKYIVVTTTQDIYNYSCTDSCITHYHYYESDPIAIGISYFDLDGTDTACPGGQALINYYLSYIPTLGYSNTYYCQDGITVMQTDTMVYTATLNTNLLCPSSLCNPSPVNMGNHDFINYSTRSSPACFYNPMNVNISTPEYLTPGVCVTCNYEDCIHEYDDCENCA